MRYFLLLFALCVVTVMGVFGKRGHHFRQPPLEIFTDMDRQPKLRPQQVVGDKGYSSQKIRKSLKRHGIQPTIAHRSNEKRTEPFDRAAYRERNRVERLINRLKQFRRVATRYEKRGDNYLAMVLIASILLWL